jgi:hypothetical protein
MKPILSAFITLAILAGAMAPASAETAQTSQPKSTVGDTKELAQALRAGGNIILVRHGATVSNRADTDSFSLSDIAKQRNLNEKGKNDVLITHKPNIIDALGKDWFDVKEGEASIFKPEGGKHRLLARVQMEDWPKIAAALH